MPSSTLSSKGQITIPLEIRRRLGLKEGDRVEFVAKGTETLIRPDRADDNPFQEFAGALPAFGSIEEINAWIREMREDEESPAP